CGFSVFCFLESLLARDCTCVLCLTLMVVVMPSCRTSAPVKAARTVPPKMPAVPQHVEPVAAAIPSKLSEVNFDDPVDLAIVQARLRFKQGEDLYKKGQLKRAKEVFNSAVALILETSAKYPKQPRLDRELMDLVARVNAMELAALRDGDGMTDQADQPAVIDELDQVETFPALIDPKLKKTVEEDVRATAHDLPIEIND